MTYRKTDGEKWAQYLETDDSAAQYDLGHVTIHSSRTGHDWIIVSNYSGNDCFILHRHSRKYPYHRQQGHFKSLKDALGYIDRHEEWFADSH